MAKAREHAIAGALFVLIGWGLWQFTTGDAEQVLNLPVFGRGLLIVGALTIMRGAYLAVRARRSGPITPPPGQPADAGSPENVRG